MLISGGRDRGIKATTNTCICLDCNSLIDQMESQTGENGEEGEASIGTSNSNQSDRENDNALELIEGLPEEDHDFLKQVFGVSNCEHRNVEIWDNIKQLCPKCGGKMKESGSSGYVLWD